jgi:hypothetical protein
LYAGLYGLDKNLVLEVVTSEHKVVDLVGVFRLGQCQHQVRIGDHGGFINDLRNAAGLFGESSQDGAVGSEYNSLPTTKNAVADFGVCLTKLLLVFLPAGVARLLQLFKIPSRDRNHVDIPSILDDSLDEP